MSRSLLLVAVPVGVLGLLAVMIGGSRSSTSSAQSTTTTTTATVASPSTSNATASTTTANAPPASTQTPAIESGQRNDAPSSASPTSEAANRDLRAPSAAKPAGDATTRPNGTSNETPTPSTANGTNAETAAGGFGVTAAAPSPATSAVSGSAPNRTWHRADELKLTIGSDTIDVTAPSAFHTGADVPVLHVGDKTLTSSSFVSPNVIRFTGVGTVAPSDEIAISYGKGAPTVLRRGASR